MAKVNLDGFSKRQTPLPASVARLRTLAYNLRWAWDSDTVELFRRLDPDLWESTAHNPALMLQSIQRSRLESAANDPRFLAQLGRVLRDFDTYLAGRSTWYGRTHGGGDSDTLIAYFSAEFGLTETLSIYSGGLGVLAGDHLKSASDLGAPLVAVGLLYKYGYFRQQIDSSGWQHEIYPPLDPQTLPLTLELRADGEPLLVEVPFPGRTVYAQIWRAQVGRVSLYLLDTNILANQAEEDRYITGHLYGGDLDTRIRHEIVLGIGGYRALEALGVRPTVYHMNEGHAAFLALERIQRLMESDGLSFEEAREEAAKTQVFTTHTPVEAGHDYFPPELMDRYFSEYIQRLGVSRRDFLGLGRQHPENDGELFCMTVLALRAADHSNAVSELHGEVSRRMWKGLQEDRAPIEHITNGVHLGTWVSDRMSKIYDSHLTPRWREDPPDQSIWEAVRRTPARKLWDAHEEDRKALVDFARARVRAQLERHGAPTAEIEAAAQLLSSERLTIGFARRFATYKRATLLFRDADRLLRIIDNPDRPAQLIFAGKSHPRDNGGKELIDRIVDLSRHGSFRGKLVFIEGYDMEVARYLVSGADVWLNNPLRPLEASGTSGMKAAANGGLNFSTLDGWWAEAWEDVKSEADPPGWAIGTGETYADAGHGYWADSEALYNLLEQEIAPLFYDRDSDGLPLRWIARMKSAIRLLAPVYNTNRMVQEYVDRFYVPEAASYGYAHSEGQRG